MFFDKTGTLTHGEPVVTDTICFSDADPVNVIRLAASVEQYSKHPLATAILRAAKDRGIVLHNVENISEKPGGGLTGHIAGQNILITGRRKLPSEMVALLPPSTSGMECVIVVRPPIRPASISRQPKKRRKVLSISHLRPKHHVKRLMILSGDRDSEVQHLAAIVGITDVRASLTPEEKLTIVRAETEKTPTLFLGDGINDAPAMMAATVIGQEVIDLFAVLNAIRASVPTKELQDF